MNEHTWESLPPSRSKAIAAGSRHYFTGKPCPEGHIARRFTSNYGCEECLRAHCRTYYERNVDDQKARFREYAKRDPEGNRRRSAQWAEKNPLMATVVRINTTSKRRGAIGVITLDEWESLIDRHGHRCIVCGAEDVTIGADHIVPIVSGGTNTIDNIQPMCWDCNRKKNRQTIDYRKQVDR